MSHPKRKSLKESIFYPSLIVEELNKYVIGQDEAKRVVAIALRNRYRRRMVKDDTLKVEIVPKNVLMIGPTGVGKTEIVRRLAMIQSVPFIKVEATKFTEIGYVGRDVESIIRDLADIAVQKIKNEKVQRSSPKKSSIHEAERVVLDVIVGDGQCSDEERADLLKRLRNHEFDDQVIEIDMSDYTSGSGNQFSFEIPGGMATVGMISLGDMIVSKVANLSKKKHQNKVTVAEAIELLVNHEEQRAVDDDKVAKSVVELVENEGIVFIDELDKLVSTASSSNRGEVSREGVQRDLLPLIEGTIVQTKYGPIKTDHILFIASGAFHAAKVSDLLPELQGRLPIKVKLKALTEKDFYRILTEPEYNLIRQYKALLDIDKIDVTITEDGILEVVRVVAKLNSHFEDIGARRLHTVMEKLLERISFDADGTSLSITIDQKYASEQLKSLFDGDQNKIENYIL